MIPAHPTCEACGAEVARGQAMLSSPGTPIVCRAVECQGLLAQRLTMSPEAYRSHFERQSRLIRAGHAREAQRQAHIAAVDSAEEEDNARIAQAVRADRADGDRLRLVMLPQGLDSPAVELTDRREKFQAHLESVVDEARGLASGEEIPEVRYKGARDRNVRVSELLERSPILDERYDQLCSMCRGGCCTTGEEHAYLTAYTIRRLLDDDPELTPDDLLRRYQELTPTRSVEGGCIQLTPSGCALPRELRSDVCNGYFCPSLVAIQDGWSEDEPTPLLVIQRAHHVWNRYVTTTANPVSAVVVLDQDGVHPINPEAASAAEGG